MTAPYRSAIDLTCVAIGARSGLFRNQAVAVVGVCTTTLIASLMLREPIALLALLGVAPVSGIFLGLDHRRVAHWRAIILDHWAQGEIDLMAFGKAMRANTLLPPVTLESMLTLLGSTQDDRPMPAASAATRRAVLDVVRLADGLAQQQLAWKVVVAAIVAIGVIYATAVQAWAALAAPALACAALPGILGWRRASIKRRSRASVALARQVGDFDAGALHGLLARLPLGHAAGPVDAWVGDVSTRPR